jgi:hypothetical protein
LTGRGDGLFSASHTKTAASYALEEPVKDLLAVHLIIADSYSTRLSRNGGALHSCARDRCIDTFTEATSSEFIFSRRAQQFVPGLFRTRFVNFADRDRHVGDDRNTFVRRPSYGDNRIEAEPTYARSCSILSNLPVSQA